MVNFNFQKAVLTKDEVYGYYLCMKFILVILIALLVVIFAVQNSVIVSVSLFNKTFEGSLALVIILCYLLGVLSGFLYIIPSIIRKNLIISDLRSKLNSQKSKEKEKEINKQ